MKKVIVGMLGPLPCHSFDWLTTLSQGAHSDCKRLGLVLNIHLGISSPSYAERARKTRQRIWLFLAYQELKSRAHLQEQ